MPAQSGLSVGFEGFLEKGGTGRPGGEKSGAPGTGAGHWSPPGAEGAGGEGCYSSYRARNFEDFWAGSEMK